MKNVLRITFLVLIALFMLPEDADAQRRRKKKKKKKKKTERKTENSINWQERLWYGAGGSLNFGGTQNQSEFTIGITPMVGFKFNKWLSAGPRLEFTYTGGRVDLGDIVKYTQFDVGAGLFARAKSPFGIYAHTEYIIRGDECLTDFNGKCFIENPSNFQGVPNPNIGEKFATKRLIRDSYYVGLGYNSSGFSNWGYEFQLNVVDFPVDIRAGLTYKF